MAETLVTAPPMLDSTGQTIATAESTQATQQTAMAASQSAIATAQCNMATAQGNIATAQGNIATAQATQATNSAAIATAEGTQATQQTTMATKLGGIDTSAASVATAQGTIATAQGSIATAEGTQATQQTTMATKLTGIDTSEATQATAQGNMATQLTAVNAKLDTLDASLNAIKDATLRVASAVGNMGGTVYAFHIDGSEDDPDSKVTYLKDAIGMRPAKMDYTNGVFDYGSWKDAFFMPRPCMVRQDGTVDYYLKEDDYTKKADGSASDVADTTYNGNAMMEWGRDGKKIWMKIEPDSGDANSCTVYIADYQVDSTYHDWPFHNCNGVSVDHFYTPIYNGSAVSDGTNDVLRSLSGQYISYSKDAATEITMAGRNNAGTAEIWGTEVYADIVLINTLLALMGKSTDTQAVFGRGLDSGSETAMKAYVTGALNDKGLFYGYDDGSHGVKVFGMENWWACQWRRYRGHIMVDGVQKVKLTYGTEDGSTAAGYNLTGANYISVGATPSGTSGQYCDKYEFTPNGAFPKDADNTKATSSTHYCDGLWFNNSGTRVPFRGGSSVDGSLAGAWFVHLSYDASDAGWGIGAALSCKPLA